MYDSLFSETNCAGLAVKNRVAAIVPPELRNAGAAMRKTIIKKLADGGAGLICAELPYDCPRHELLASCKAAHDRGSRIFLSLPEKTFAAVICAKRAAECGFDGVYLSTPALLGALRLCFGDRLRMICRAASGDAHSLRRADMVCIDDNSNINAGGRPVIRLCDGISPANADALIASGRADIIAPYRSLIADTDWCKKAQNGGDDAIRPCMSCRSGCGSSCCAINPGLYLPAEVKKAETPCRIAVIGGGAAAMSFALLSAERGHTVDVFERGTRLGGRLRELSRCEEYLRWLTMKLCRMPRVQIFTGSVFRGDHDTVVCAADAAPLPLPELKIPDCVRLFSAVDFLSGKEELGVLSGKRVAVAGGDAAAELSERLLLAGIAKSVAFISGEDMPCAGGAERIFPAKPLRFSDGVLLVKRTVSEKREPLVCAVSCDAVIIDTGYSEVKESVNAPFAKRIFRIAGDSSAEDIASGIKAGYLLASRI